MLQSHLRVHPLYACLLRPYFIFPPLATALNRRLLITSTLEAFRVPNLCLHLVISTVSHILL